MRILYLVGQLGLGGLERQLCFLLEGMDRERYKPAVVVWNYRNSDPYVSAIQKIEVPLYSLPAARTRVEKLIAFRRLVTQLKPEVVHSYSFYTNCAASWAASATSTVAVGAVQSDFLNDRNSCGSVLGNLSARWPRVQIYNNYAAAKNARRFATVFLPREILVVRNGLDLTRFRRVALPTQGPVRILCVGSLLHVKRWDRVLNAAASLKKRSFDFQVEIAGDGPMRASLEQLAQKLDVCDRVDFLGHARNVPELMAASTFLVHTSETEGCPNAVVEAMACGRAVVATDAGDVPSLVDDGRTGFVVHREDSSALTERMATLIIDRALCAQMGEAGRLKAEDEFGLTRLVSETLAAYRTAGWTDRSQDIERM